MWVQKTDFDSSSWEFFHLEIWTNPFYLFPPFSSLPESDGDEALDDDLDFM